MVQNQVEEDHQIVKDVASEFLEKLGTMELTLIELEHDPSDYEAIDSLFRDFHSIKGVSGFFGLGQINTVTHSAENLLSKARKGQIRIEGKIVDIILEAVDMVKHMIEGIQASLENSVGGVREIDPMPLVARMEAIQGELEQFGEKPIGQILVSRGAVSREEVEAGLARQKANPRKKLGNILVEEKTVRTKEVISALRTQRMYGGHHTELQVKVARKKIERLIDLLGDLANCREILREDEWIRSGKNPRFGEALNRLDHITDQLQRIALSMRMVPIKNIFQKMVRPVRDLSRTFGKEIALTMAGEDTEIDRGVAGELYEPMVHMIRNAVDHGIEKPEERERLGKDRMGVIHLGAHHMGANVIVEITDDGRGLNGHKIMEVAKEKGFVKYRSGMSETKIHNLIFQPGVTTAPKVTAFSGRGIGMDVVKKAVEKFGGRLSIQSKPGIGSTFWIHIPHIGYVAGEPFATVRKE